MAKSLKPKICVSVICTDLLNIEKDLDILEEEGVDYFHFDIMDSYFVPRSGLSIKLLEKITEKYSIPVEVHLMVNKPDEYIDKIVEAGGSAFIIHPEGSYNTDEIISNISRYKNIKVGLALKPETHLDIVIPYMNKLESIMLMAYPPGTIGEKPIKNFTQRISELNNLLFQYKKLNIDIAVDGGVNLYNLGTYLDNGATMFVLGSSGLFVDGIKLKAQIKLIKKTLNII